MTDTSKVGDRVRVIYEGTVLSEIERPGHPRYRFELEGPDGVSRWVNPEWTASIEKLEPRWVNGDVVRTKVGNRAVRLNGDWIWLIDGTRSHLPDAWWSREWSEGYLEILYKADAQTETA